MVCVTVVRAPSVYILEGTGRQKCSHCKVNVYIVIVVVMCTILDSAQDHKIIAAQDSSTKFDVLRAYQDDTSGFHHGPLMFIYLRYISMFIYPWHNFTQPSYKAS